MAKLDSHFVIRTLLIVLAACVLFALIAYYNKSQKTTEKYEDDTEEKREYFYQDEPKNPLLISGGKEQVDAVQPAEESGDADYRPVDYSSQKLPNDCFPKDRLTAEDLLPKDAANSKWAQVNAAGQGDLANQNLLSAGYQIGISTVSGSLRNANLQLRSEPPNPRIEGLSPWMQTTIVPDVQRRPLEIGGDCGSA